MRTTLIRFLVAAVAGAAVFGARADAVPPPQGVLNLTASATVEVPRDVLQITFSTTRDGPDANAVQSQLKQALDAALAEARKAAKPGQVDVQTGAFSLTPRYAPKGGTITGWQGTAELVVEGRDIAAVSQLAGRITTLTVGRAAYNLSREAREKAEADVSAQAIARYRAHAAEYAKQFGYAGYAIREVSVNASDAMPPPMPRMRSMAAAAAPSEDLPVEAGRTTVTVQVNGTIQMK
jgi:predicted secreted protein